MGPWRLYLFKVYQKGAVYFTHVIQEFYPLKLSEYFHRIWEFAFRQNTILPWKLCEVNWFQNVLRHFIKFLRRLFWHICAYLWFVLKNTWLVLELIKHGFRVRLLSKRWKNQVQTLSKGGSTASLNLMTQNLLLLKFCYTGHYPPSSFLFAIAEIKVTYENKSTTISFQETSHHLSKTKCSLRFPCIPTGATAREQCGHRNCGVSSWCCFHFL